MDFRWRARASSFAGRRRDYRRIRRGQRCRCCDTSPRGRPQTSPLPARAPGGQLRAVPVRLRDCGPCRGRCSSSASPLKTPRNSPRSRSPSGVAHRRKSQPPPGAPNTSVIQKTRIARAHGSSDTARDHARRSQRIGVQLAPIIEAIHALFIYAYS